ncbi:hypothetical protein CMO84_06725 [Candidatus Woesearchaeota archaeon]|nr:hypothetical protein [Candidatus Woesearchaeota archaeon]
MGLSQLLAQFITRLPSGCELELIHPLGLSPSVPGDTHGCTAVLFDSLLSALVHLDCFKSDVEFLLGSGQFSIDPHVIKGLTIGALKVIDVPNDETEQPDEQEEQNNREQPNGPAHTGRGGVFH